jgi:hypothetical protein
MLSDYCCVMVPRSCERSTGEHCCSCMLGSTARARSVNATAARSTSTNIVYIACSCLDRMPLLNFDALLLQASHWVFWAGPLVGAVFALLLWEIILRCESHYFVTCLLVGNVCVVIANVVR